MSNAWLIAFSQYTPTIKDTFYLTSKTDPSQKLLVTDTGDWNECQDQLPSDSNADYDAYIVVYDRTRLGTFEDVELRAKALLRLRKPLLLVSTMYQSKEPQVSRQHGFELARKYKWDFLEDIWTRNEGEEGKEQGVQSLIDSFTKITIRLQSCNYSRPSGAPAS